MLVSKTDFVVASTIFFLKKKKKLKEKSYINFFYHILNGKTKQNSFFLPSLVIGHTRPFSHMLDFTPFC